MTQATVTIGLTNDGDLELVLPGLDGLPDWTVMLPSDEAKCVAMIHRILSARNKQLNRIGFDGAPTQAIAEAWLKSGGANGEGNKLKRVAVPRARDFRGDGSVEVRTVPAKGKGKISKTMPGTNKTLDECGL